MNAMLPCHFADGQGVLIGLYNIIITR